MEELPEIDVQQANELLAEGKALLLDVRETEEWDAGHAPNARLMPLSTFDISALETDTPLVVVCRAGSRSARATEALVAAGMNATNVAGGMTAWEIAGLPVIRDDGSDGLVI